MPKAVDQRVWRSERLGCLVFNRAFTFLQTEPRHRAGCHANTKLRGPFLIEWVPYPHWTICKKKWRECYQEQQALKRKISRLEGELAEAARKRDIAAQNAYAEGYQAARDDLFQQTRKKRSGQST
jgi:flagellar biosynthesis/type III secretory pathway protein FliH